MGQSGWVVGLRDSETPRTGGQVAIVVAGLLLAVAVATSAPAGADAVVRLSTRPDDPRPGQIALVEMRTYAADASRPGSLGPPTTARADYPFVVVAVSPLGQRFDVRLVRDVADPQLWTAEFTFEAEGLWTLQVIEIAREAAPTLEVVVGPRLLATTGLNAGMVLALAVALVGFGVVLLSKRRPGKVRRFGTTKNA